MATVFPISMTADGRVFSTGWPEYAFRGIMAFLNCTESEFAFPEFSLNEYNTETKQCENDEMIVITYKNVRCIDVYVNSTSGNGLKNEDGLLIGPAETGDGSFQNPFCNLNTAYRLAACYVRNTCCPVAIHIHLKGTVDYQIFLGDFAWTGLISDVNSFSNRLFITSWEDESEEKAKISIEITGGTDENFAIYDANGVLFKNIVFELKINDPASKECGIIGGFENIFIGCEFFIQSNSTNALNYAINRGYSIANFVDCSMDVSGEFKIVMQGNYVKNFNIKNEDFYLNTAPAFSLSYVENLSWSGNLKNYGTTIFMLGRVYKTNLKITCAPVDVTNQYEIISVGEEVSNSTIEVIANGQYHVLYGRFEANMFNSNIKITGNASDDYFSVNCVYGFALIEYCQLQFEIGGEKDDNATNCFASCGNILNSDINITFEKEESSVRGFYLSDVENCNVTVDVKGYCYLTLCLSSFPSEDYAKGCTFNISGVHNSSIIFQKMKEVSDCNININTSCDYVDLTVFDNISGLISGNDIEIKSVVGNNMDNDVVVAYLCGCTIDGNEITASLSGGNDTSFYGTYGGAGSMVANNNISATCQSYGHKYEGSNNETLSKSIALAIGFSSSEGTTFSGNSVSLKANASVDKTADWWSREEVTCNLGEGKRITESVSDGQKETDTSC